jgi:Ca2+/H+ antiporter
MDKSTTNSFLSNPVVAIMAHFTCQQMIHELFWGEIPMVAAVVAHFTCQQMINEWMCWVDQ